MGMHWTRSVLMTFELVDRSIRHLMHVRPSHILALQRKFLYTCMNAFVLVNGWPKIYVSMQKSVAEFLYLHAVILEYVVYVSACILYVSICSLCIGMNLTA